MAIIKRLIIFLCTIMFSTVFAGNLALSKSVKNQLESELDTTGTATVIIGLSGMGTVKTLNTSIIKSTKTQFLRSTALVMGLVSQSIKVVDELDYLPFLVLEVKSAGLKTLLSHPQISSIESDRKFKAFLTSTVPAVVGVSNPWSKSIYDGQGSWVAILDTGINTAHPMFAGKQIIQACFTSDNSCPNNTNTQYGNGASNPVDKGDHGTHVAGIAVGKFIPAKGMGGVAHKANLIAIQVFDSDKRASMSSVIRALNYVYLLAGDNKVVAANLSLGDGTFNINEDCEAASPSMTFTIKKLRDRNIATVAAGGDNGYLYRTAFPACIRDAIAVASATRQTAISSFSNISPYVSLIAPGSNIESASFGASYKNYSGTSMATAFITGAFAALRKQRPKATVSAIETALQNTGKIVRRLSPPYRYSFFWPLLNKAKNNIGGTTQTTTAIGFNTESSINRFTHFQGPYWQVDTSDSLGANGVAYTISHPDRNPASFFFPQTLLTGRISAKLKRSPASYGISIKSGGSTFKGTRPNEYRLYVIGQGYRIEKFENSNYVVIANSGPNAVPFINSNEWNILMATFGGKSIKFFINGNLIAEHASDEIIYGAPGVLAGNNTFIDWFVTKSNVVNDRYR